LTFFVLWILAVPAVSFFVGFLVGRWWALLGAVAVGVTLTLSEDYGDIAPWFVGLVYAVVVGLGVAAGVGFRKRTDRRDHVSD
jgi:hypothetical protein